jgi:acyl carrier protein
MSDIEQRVKKIVAEQLGVAEADIKPNRRSLTIWALTRWTP